MRYSEVAQSKISACLFKLFTSEYPCFGLWEEICSIRFIPLNKGAAWRSKPTPKVDRHHSSLVSVDTVPEAGWEERAVGIWDLEFQDCPKSRYLSQRPAYPFLLQLILSVQGPPKGFFMPDFGLLFSDTNVPDLCSHFLHGWLDSIQCCMKGKRTVCLSRLSIFSPSRVPCASGSRRTPPPPRSLLGCPLSSTLQDEAVGSQGTHLCLPGIIPEHRVSPETLRAHKGRLSRASQAGPQGRFWNEDMNKG